MHTCLNCCFRKDEVGLSLHIAIILFLFSALIYSPQIRQLWRRHSRGWYSSCHPLTVEWAGTAFYYLVRICPWTAVNPKPFKSKKHNEVCLIMLIHGTPFTPVHWYSLWEVLFSATSSQFNYFLRRFEKYKKSEPIWRKPDWHMVHF